MCYAIVCQLFQQFHLGQKFQSQDYLHIHPETVQTDCHLITLISLQSVGFHSNFKSSFHFADTSFFL